MNTIKVKLVIKITANFLKNEIIRKITLEFLRSVLRVDTVGHWP